MALKQTLQTRQTLSPILTPQMQLALRILQLNNLQLEQFVAAELERNPLLERADEMAVGGFDSAESGGAFVNAGEIIEQSWSGVPSLQSALRAQLGEAALPPAIGELALLLVGWVDDDGYLRDSDAVLCEALGVEMERLSAALAAVRDLQPVGVFARNLPDCLYLQAVRSPHWSPELGRLIDNLEMLARETPAKLAARCGVDTARLGELVGTLRLFSPKPGAAYCAEEQALAVPDVVVAREGAGWQAALNEARLPKLLLRAGYGEELPAPPDAETRAFLDERAQSGRWLIRAMGQRAARLLGVARAIVARQQAYFDAGAGALAPLTLAEIAEAEGVHESTVSRIVANKLVATPRGVVEMKSFFSAALGGAEGSSGGAARARIAALIAAETADEILSDDRLVALLRGEGILLARRTVAKYREGLGLGSSVERRKAARLRAL